MFGIESATGDKRYKLLARIVKRALCIHHGNADVGWSLLDNKNTVTDVRTRLSKAIINGLRLAKDFVPVHDENVSNVTKEMVEAGKKAHGIRKRKLKGKREN